MESVAGLGQRGSGCDSVHHTVFVFGVISNTTVALTAYIGGLLLVIVGLVDLANPNNRAGEWIEGVLGVLVFISPFVLGFSGITMMAWSAGIIGVLSILLAASVLFDDRGQKTLTAH
jgi:hypothetical protein